MTRIPILSAGFGEGHNAAARAIAEALGRTSGGALEGQVHDLFLTAYGADRARRQRDAYIGVANRHPASGACFTQAWTACPWSGPPCPSSARSSAR